MKKTKNSSKKNPYIRYSLWGIGASIAIYIIIYFSFKGEGIISTGIDLNKSDWLAFIGSYLSFSGTVIVSGIAIFQTHYYAKLSKNESVKKRVKDIQPIFSIEIGESNTPIAGTAESFNPWVPEQNPRHQNFTFKIENVSLYPIKHVTILDKYIVQLLKSNETHILQGAYEDSPDYDSKNIIKVLQSDYERSANGLPKRFNITYEDVDGNDMVQLFELNNFDGQNYYALVEITEA